jgi:NAD(P)-dependent dehydrogenase (short-subunit alcohol dehydrogenase family)
VTRPNTSIVTGATSGIGFEVARILASRGGPVIGVGRDGQRCEAAARRLREVTGNPRVRFEVADLSSLAQVRALAGRILQACPRVDVLVNNAGAFAFRWQATAEGLERQFALNYLSGYLLTRLLLPALQGPRGPSSESAAGRSRVVMVSSGSHYTGRMHWKDVGIRRFYNGLAAYDQSKLACVLFARELARRLGPGSAVSIAAADPGLVSTDIGLKGTNALVRLVWRLRAHKGISAAESAATVAWLALDPSVGRHSGLYWKECRVETPSRRGRDDRDAARLWELSGRMCARWLEDGISLTAGEASATLSA